MIPKSSHFSSFSKLLLLAALVLGIRVSASSRPKISYTDYCRSVVPQFPATAVASSFSSFQIYSTHYTGGEKLLAPDPRDSPTSLDYASASFRFKSHYAHKTQSADILQIGGSLSFQGPQFTVNRERIYGHHWGSISSQQVYTNNHVNFELSGFWSESTGNVCMVGTGSVHHFEGKTLHLSAVFKLNYPKISNISTSFVSGTVESLDLVDSPSFFEKISVLAYAQNNYSYMEFPHSIRDSCTNLVVPKESRGFESSSLASYLPSLFYTPLRLEYGNDCNGGNCYPFTLRDGSLPRFLSLNQISFSAEGKFHMLAGFSNSEPHTFHTPLEPGNTLVGEGFWDHEKNQMCLVACHVVANASVGDCTVGLSLWFPLVFSIKSRSTIMGHLWTTKINNDPTYFSIKSFGEDRRMNLVPNMKYEYSVLDSPGVFDAIKNSASMGYRTYPDGSSRQDLSFSISLTQGDITGSGYGFPLSFGETVFVDPSMETPMESVNATLWNVSYDISYFLYNKPSFTSTNHTKVSAEGYYNSRTGLLCMVGCKYTSSSDLDKQGKVDDSMDCNILINVQFPPTDPKEGEHLNGTIRSRRDKMDPLYFEPLLVLEHKMYEIEASKSIWRMDIEIILVVISLTLSCFFIRSQILYAKRRGVLADISVTMLIVMTLGYLISLILNSEALLVLIQNRQNSFFQIAKWTVVKDAVDRVLTLVAFVLHLSLLQLVWSARSESGRKQDLWVAEKKTLKFCLLFYFAGAAIGWFIHSMFQPQGWKWEDLLSYAGCILDGFLFPQVVMNLFQRSSGKALSLPFYVGMTFVRIFPHFFDLYRARSVQPHLEFSYTYASSKLDLFSPSWDIIIPFTGILLAACIFMQQRFGGSYILPPRLRKQVEYVSIAELSL